MNNLSSIQVCQWFCLTSPGKIVPLYRISQLDKFDQIIFKVNFRVVCVRVRTHTSVCVYKHSHSQSFHFCLFLCIFISLTHISVSLCIYIECVCVHMWVVETKHWILFYSVALYFTFEKWIFTVPKITAAYTGWPKISSNPWILLLLPNKQ